MSKAPKTDLQHKPDILHLLEYCRLDRAAELLGCEVCDLLHLADMNEISLYWNFKSQPAITRPGWIKLDEYERKMYRGGTIIMADFAEACAIDPDGLDGIDKLNSNTDIPVLLFGLWGAEDRHTGRYMRPENDPVTCRWESPYWRRNESVITFALPAYWQAPPAEEMCIMQGDIRRLRKAITTGEQLEDSIDREYSTVEDASEPAHQASRQLVRESTKPYRALVNLMEATGFTQEDFRGSIPALQTKLAHKGLGGELTSIDEKTLADWLKRAGVR